MLALTLAFADHNNKPGCALGGAQHVRKIVVKVLAEA